MTTNINLFAAAPDMMKEWQRAMTQLSTLADFDSTITELVKLRASHTNGCVNCINLHVIEARERGETEQRIYRDIGSRWKIQTTALDIQDGKICAIFVVRNPDKLRHLHH